MTVRVVVHHRDDFKSVLGIEGRSLEAERHEKHLTAASPARLLLRCREQPRPQSLVAPRLLHPELAYFRATAPRIPTDPGNDPPVFVPHEDRQPRAVRDTCCGNVELVEPILQVLNVAWRRLGADDEFRRVHLRALSSQNAMERRIVGPELRATSMAFPHDQIPRRRIN